MSYERVPTLVNNLDRSRTTSSSSRTQHNGAGRHGHLEGWFTSPRAYLLRATLLTLFVPTDSGPSNHRDESAHDILHHRPHLHGHLHSERLKDSFSPSTHELVGEKLKPSDTTDRVYNYSVQKWRLWRLSILEWLTTLALCASIFGCLWYYHNSDALQPVQINVFNAIITGLSIALGLNLNGSLKSYARMMRWRLLMARYQPLEQFDLIMGCDRLANVIKLFFKSWGTHVRFLPSLTGLLCLLWIVINVASTVLVASLGLTYSLEPSDKRVNIDNGGLTSVVQLHYITSADTTHQSQLITAQQYGLTGNFFNVVQGIELSDAVGLGTINQDRHTPSHFRYWFIDENPLNADMAANAGISGRFIDSSTACSTYPVVDGGYGNLTYIVYTDSGRNVTQTIGSIGAQEPGAMTYISELTSTCGSRCTRVKAFQPIYLSNADGLGSVYDPHFFICNSTVHNVQEYIDSTVYDVLDNVQMPDEVAKIIAGVPGWSGSQPANSTEELQTYSRQAIETFNNDATVEGVEEMISSFAIATVAALDDHGPRKNISGADPVVANVLKVGRNWREAGSLLAVIPTIHFLAMIAVLIWADKAIILDDTSLAAAKFLKPMMDRLETKGNLMRGEDIVQILKNPRVKYGWRYIDGNVLHADIYEESMAVVVGPEFRSGVYD